jgi:hypothetical protein
MKPVLVGHQEFLNSLFSMTNVFGGALRTVIT